MQRIIQINIAGRIIPIEEDAYQLLKDYLTALERHFTGEAGREEIIGDIENRIAELFAIRLQSGAPAIDRQDVMKVLETLGMPSDLGNPQAGRQAYMPAPYSGPQPGYDGRRRLYRNPKDKMLGGVCSGLAVYFDIDPVIMRLLFVVLLFMGIGIIAYIVAWAVIPLARTPLELSQMEGGPAFTFNSMAHNLGSELQDLKKRGEDMSRELRDFFSRKK